MNYIINLLKLTLLYIFVAIPLIVFNATISLLLAIASNLIKAIKPTTTTHKQNKKGEQ